MDKYYIPKYLDEPTKLIIFTIDELVILVIPILIGLFTDKLLLGLTMGFGLMSLLKKLKGEEGHYFIYHLLYWYVPQLVKLKSTPPSYIRDILG